MIHGRIQSLVEFWPNYLSEQRSPVCRHLNFVGLTGLLGFLVHGFALSPVATSLALLVQFLGVSVFLRRVEPTKSAPGLFFLIMFCGVAFNPAALAPGWVWAYFFAWLGHDKLQGRRRMILSYPAWSLVGDFRLYILMLRGRLWTHSSFARQRFR